VTGEPRPASSTRADLVLRIGIGVIIAGLLFTLIAIIPLLLPSVSMPSALWFFSMLIGVGLIIVFVGLVLGSRSRRAPTRRTR
jgi:VIT1/CCC1 family predicted Fe2+/Mn2+ transporter